MNLVASEQTPRKLVKSRFSSACMKLELEHEARVEIDSSNSEYTSEKIYFFYMSF